MSKTDLYRHYDANGVLLYVGISLSTLARLQQHRCGSHWADKIRRWIRKRRDEVGQPREGEG